MEVAKHCPSSSSSSSLYGEYSSIATSIVSMVSSMVSIAVQLLAQQCSVAVMQQAIPATMPGENNFLYGYLSCRSLWYITQKCACLLPIFCSLSFWDIFSFLYAGFGIFNDPGVQYSPVFFPQSYRNKVRIPFGFKRQDFDSLEFLFHVVHLIKRLLNTERNTHAYQGESSREICTTIRIG